MEKYLTNLDPKLLDVFKFGMLIYLATSAIKGKKQDPVLIVNNFYYPERKTNG